MPEGDSRHHSFGGGNVAAKELLGRYWERGITATTRISLIWPAFAGHFLFRALACLLKGLACDRAYFWFSEKIVGRRSHFVLAIRDRTIIIAAIPLR
jgi:hypothetical protein